MTYEGDFQAFIEADPLYLEKTKWQRVERKMMDFRSGNTFDPSDDFDVVAADMLHPLSSVAVPNVVLLPDRACRIVKEDPPHIGAADTAVSDLTVIGGCSSQLAGYLLTKEPFSVAFGEPTFCRTGFRAVHCGKTYGRAVEHKRVTVPDMGHNSGHYTTSG